ncbi:hypothetical protein MTP99_016238 [Tenebrio molitor]|nr:hypothetical protein MTP99_016238 [Tenebrio molitor]
MWRRMLKNFRNFSTTNVARDKIRHTIKAAFGKYLLWTNTASCGVLMFLGDLIDQEIHYRKKVDKTWRYDYMRLGRMFIVGLAVGPAHHYYYNFINVVWPRRNMPSIGKKILADQLIASPICIVLFFYTLGLLEGKKFSDATEELKHKFVSVYTVDWMVWPPTQFINFYLVPVRYQVLYINTVTMFYDVFLSFIKHEYDYKMSTSEVLLKEL